jgi:atlastin
MSTEEASTDAMVDQEVKHEISPSESEVSPELPPAVSDDLSLDPSEIDENLSDDLSVDPPEDNNDDKDEQVQASSEKSEESWDKVSDALPEDCALQIVSIGTETNQYAFTFHEDALDLIMKQVPSGSKVSVVSVVGAFRTGKSFLLSWFLKYLNHHEALHAQKDNVIEEEEEKNKENDDRHWYDEFNSLGNDGFDWRGGAERNTTGIWMWSKPFILPRTLSDGSREDVAVLLVDTQGMFDHETTMGLTAAIFGLSTLLSSYQIYNVDKRIQEDNLQQLALFSEYGRMALKTDGHEEEHEKEESCDTDAEVDKKKQMKRPFQHIEFLVRDWQNFEDDEDIEMCEKEMSEYLEAVLAEREATDLKDTREQIISCFENVSCYLMTHPGFSVTKKKYAGEISSVEPTFIAFMDRYCKRVFENPIAKCIHGRELTSPELTAYIRSYASMFATGAHFPEAATMLEATANANNSNATNLSMRKYKECMDFEAGAKCSDYLNPSELEQKHKKLCEECLELFDDIANFGNVEYIRKSRNEVIKYMEESFEMYSKLNDSRNPLLGMETYIIPLLIGFAAIILRKLTDFTCSEWSTTCKVGSDLLSHIYQVVFFFMLIVASTKAKQISEATGRLKKAIDVLSSNSSEKKKV